MNRTPEVGYTGPGRRTGEPQGPGQPADREEEAEGGAAKVGYSL